MNEKERVKMNENERVNEMKMTATAVKLKTTPGLPEGVDRSFEWDLNPGTVCWRLDALPRDCQVLTMICMINSDNNLHVNFRR